MIIDFTMAKIERICTAENNVREKLSRVLECMDISPGERAVALNCAIYRVRHGGQVATALNEGIQYARYRELEHAREKMAEWYKLENDRFVPAWDEPDGAA